MLFSRKNDVQSRLMVTDGPLKLDYVSEIFVDPEVQDEETLLNSLITVATCSLLYARSPVVYISANYG